MQTFTLAALLLIGAAGPDPVNTAIVVGPDAAARIERTIYDALPAGADPRQTAAWIKARGGIQVESPDGRLCFHIPPDRGELSVPRGTVVIQPRFRCGCLGRVQVTIQD